VYGLEQSYGRTFERIGTKMIAQIDNDIEPHICDALCDVSAINLQPAPTFVEHNEVFYILASTAVFTFILVVSLLFA
jgi:hypothetical protein